MIKHTPLDLSVLKSITSNKKNATKFAKNSDASLFSSDLNHFANSLLSYIKVFKDVPTLRTLGEFDKKLDQTYLNKIWSAIESHTYNESEFSFDVEKLKNRKKQFELIALKDSLNKADVDNIDISSGMKTLQKAVKNISSLGDSNTNYKIKSMKEYLSEYKDRFKFKRANPGEQGGFKTGYKMFDTTVGGGVSDSDLILLAAETGGGKSLLLMNMAIGMWMQNNTLDTKEFSTGENIMYFSLEMPYEQIFQRVLSNISLVPYKKIQSPHLLNKTEIGKMKVALDFIHRFPCDFEIIDIQQPCANDLESIIADYNNYKKVSAAFVDYIGIMTVNDPSGDSQDWLKQSIICEEVRAIGRKFAMPIFSAVQLNRKTQSKEPGDNIGLHRLARSNGIASHATTIIQIEGSGVDHAKTDVLLKCHFLKNRNGPLVTFNLSKNLACCSLKENKEDVDGMTGYQEGMAESDITSKLEDIEI
jgi:replicative DNA helicase